MGINVKLGTEKNRDKPFPKLMQSNNGILIFALSATEEGGHLAGVVIRSFEERYDCGYFSDKWNALIFHDYEGSITLENK